jgi:hypothetical protein
MANLIQAVAKAKAKIKEQESGSSPAKMHAGGSPVKTVFGALAMHGDLDTYQKKAHNDEGRRRRSEILYPTFHASTDMPNFHKATITYLTFLFHFLMR